jgi:hypothetical protein
MASDDRNCSIAVASRPSRDSRMRPMISPQRADDPRRPNFGETEANIAIGLLRTPPTLIVCLNSRQYCRWAVD